MPRLTTLTFDADGTLDSVNGQHDAGTGSPWYTHCNDEPDLKSTDYVENAPTETTAIQWLSLSNVDSNFSSMDDLRIKVDVLAQSFTDDTCTLTARIYDADNDVTNALTDETGNLATEADTTRTTRIVNFSGLAGTEAQWNTAHIRLTWTYTKNPGPDNGTIRLFGAKIDGNYTGDSVTSGSSMVRLPVQFDLNDSLNRGLVAWWPFRQSGGNTLRDVVAKHHAALTGFGGDEWQVGFAGNLKSLAYNPSGGDDRATATGFPHLPGAFTLSAWIKSTVVDTLYRSIIERGPWTSTNCNFDFGLRSSGTSPGIYCFWKDNTTLRGKGAVGAVGAVTDASDGEWHHVVATVDSNFDLVIYNNGQVATTDGANTGSADNSAALTIGGSTSGTAFMGSISDARIYDRALSASEVLGLYQESRRGYPTQFKRRSIPLPSTSVTAPDSGTSVARLRSPSPVTPSYKAGYAKSASESAFPGLWDGLRFASGGLGDVGILRDQSRHKTHGTLVNSPTSEIRGGRKCFTFVDASSQYVDHGDTTVFDQATATLTVAAWVKIDVSGWNGLVTKGRAFDSATGFTWYLGQLNTNVVRWALSNTSNVASYTDSAAYTGSEWNLWTGTLEADGTTRLFQNETQVATGSFTGTVDYAKTYNYFRQASGYTSGAYDLDGSISSVYVWDRPLSANEIQTLYLDSLAPFRRRRSIPLPSASEVAGGGDVLPQSLHQIENGMVHSRAMHNIEQGFIA